MTTIFARSRSAMTARSPACGRARSTSTTPPPARRSRASSLRRRRSAASASSTRRSPAARPAPRTAQLTVMVGGDQATFDKAKPVIDAYAKMVGLMGPVGAGPAHQDGQPDLHRRAGPGAFRGHPFRQEGRPRRREGDRRHLQGRRAILADGEPLEDDERGPFHARLCGRTGCERICRSRIAEARKNGAHLPVAALVDQFYSEVQAMGGGRWDTSSLIARLEREG